MAAQDHAIAQDFQPVALERCAGGGDVDHEFSDASCRRAFCSARTLHDAVVANAFLREEAARGTYVLRRNAKLAASGCFEARGDVLFDGRPEADAQAQTAAKGFYESLAAERSSSARTR